MKGLSILMTFGVMMHNLTVGQVVLCPGDIVELSAPDSLSNVIWNTGDSTDVIVVSDGGIYTYSAEWDSLTVTGSIEVLNGEIPVMPVIPDAELCDGQTYSAFSNLDTEFQWSWSCDNPLVGSGLMSNGTGTGLSFNAFTGSEVTSSYFSLIGESTDGCADTIHWMVQVFPKPQWIPSQPDNSCVGEEVALNLEQCCITDPNELVQFTWSASANGDEVESGTGPLIAFDVDTEGDYVIDAVATLGQCASDLTLGMTVYPYPEFSLVASSFACAGEEVLIECETEDPTIQATWSWTLSNPDAAENVAANANMLSLTAVNDNASLLELTAISVDANFNGCMVSKMTELTVHGLPIINPLGSLEVCGGADIPFPPILTLSATPVQVNWEMGMNGVLPALTGVGVLPEGVIAPNSSLSQNDLVILVPEASGCVGNQAVLELSISPTPDLVLPTFDNVLCPGESWSYSFQNGPDGIVPSSTEVSWSVGSPQSELVDVPEGFMMSAIELGVLSHSQAQSVPIYVEVVASVGACLGSNLTVELILQPALNPSIQGNLVACEGEDVLLTANEPSGRPANYTWTAEGTEFSHEGNSYWGVLPSAPLLNLTAVDIETGCSFSSSEAIHVDEMVEYDVEVSGPLQFCAGQTVSFEIESNGGVVWNSGQTTDIFIVSESGSYSAIVSTGACSDVVGPFYVEVWESPEVQLSGDDMACFGEELVYAAVGDGLFQWFVNGSFANLGSPHLEFEAQSNVWVTVTTLDVNGCTASDTVLTIVEAATNFSIPDLIQRCPGDSVSIVEPEWTAGWMWSGIVAGDSDSIVVAPGNDGMIFISTDPAENCVWMDSVEIESIDVPAISIVGDSEICRGEFVAYEASLPLENADWQVLGAEGLLVGDGWLLSQVADTVSTLLISVQGETGEQGCLVSAGLEVNVLGELPEEVLVEELGFGIYVFPVELSVIRWGVTDNLTGNELVVGEGNQLFSFDSYSSGQYGKWVEYGSSQNCLRRTDLADVLSLTEQSVAGLKVYPNPVRENPTLSWSPNAESADVILYDIQGREALCIRNVASGSTLEVGALPPGVYVIKVTVNGQWVEFVKMEKQ